MDNRNNPIIIDGRTGSKPSARPSSHASSLLSTGAAHLLARLFRHRLRRLSRAAFPPAAACWSASSSAFGLVFAIRATRKTPALALGLFLLLALRLRLHHQPEINMFLHTSHTDIVFNAAVTTAVGMAVLGIGAQFFTFDYRKVANYALAALLALVIVGVLGMFFHFVSPTFYSWARSPSSACSSWSTSCASATAATVPPPSSSP